MGLAADGLSVMAPGKVLQQEVTYLDSICRGKYGYPVEEGRKCLPGLQTEVTVVLTVLTVRQDRRKNLVSVLG